MTATAALVAVMAALTSGPSPSTVSAASSASAHTETIHTTANHPWLTADRGWVPAGELRVGVPVVTLNGA